MVRGPNSKLVTNGLEAQNENKHSSPNKIGHLQYIYVHMCILDYDYVIDSILR